MNMSDKEQVQMFKDWWKKYGTSVLTVILIFALANFGWRYWQNYQYQKMSGASLLYSQLLSAKSDNKTSEMKLFADNLIKNYSRTPYASLGALTLATTAIADHDYQGAINHFQWVIKHSKVKSFRQLARIRAARVLLANKKDSDALQILEQVDDDAYTAMIDEVRGDALLAMGKQPEAVIAYQKAMDSMKGNITKAPPLLKVKLEQYQKQDNLVN